MDGTPGNMILGAPSNIKLGAYGAVEGDCTVLGITEGGLKVTSKVGIYEFKCDQAVGTTDVAITERGYTIEFDIAEPTLANFYKALGYPSTQLVGSTLSLGNSTTVTKYVMFINGPGPLGGTRKATLWKVVPIGEPVMVLSKKDKTTWAMKFLVLQDTGKSDAEQFGKIDDSGVDATPPTIEMTTPAEDGTVTKATKGTVLLTFTEAGQGIDEGSLVDGKTISIINVTAQAENVQVAGSWAYDSATKTLTFTPTDVWVASDKLCVVITTGVRDMAGNALATMFIGNFTVTS